jgi:hypothetical protein
MIEANIYIRYAEVRVIINLKDSVHFDLFYFSWIIVIVNTGNFYRKLLID